METKLDEMDEGKTDYITMLHEFYDDLESTLSKAKTEMQGQKIQLQEDITDIKCEKCGREVIIPRIKAEKMIKSTLEKP